MSSENTSPLLSVRPRSVLASRPLLLRGEGFGFNAWSAAEYDRDTDRSCWSPLEWFHTAVPTPSVAKRCQANILLRSYHNHMGGSCLLALSGSSRGHRIYWVTRCCMRQRT